MKINNRTFTWFFFFNAWCETMYYIWSQIASSFTPNSSKHTFGNIAIIEVFFFNIKCVPASLSIYSVSYYQTISVTFNLDHYYYYYMCFYTYKNGKTYSSYIKLKMWCDPWFVCLMPLLMWYTSPGHHSHKLWKKQMRENQCVEFLQRSQLKRQIGLVLTLKVHQTISIEVHVSENLVDLSVGHLFAHQFLHGLT